MQLHNLPKSGGFKKRKRVGRGESSGMGKTAGRGNKGQRSRSGASLRPGFESGHIPTYRKLPKRGFNNSRFAVNYEIVNIGDLARISGDVANRESMAAAGLIDPSAVRVKILGNGELDKALTVEAEKFSSGARSKIEAAGGKVVVLQSAQEAPAETETPAAE